jgi:hypothetical protein
MTIDDITDIALEAFGEMHELFWMENTDKHLVRFAELIAAAEREACAMVAESYEPECDTCPSGVSNAIRARGKE